MGYLLVLRIAGVNFTPAYVEQIQRLPDILSIHRLGQQRIWICHDLSAKMGGYHNSEQFMARKPEKIVTNNGMEIPSGRLQKTQRCPAIGMEQGSWSLQKKGYIS